ncbi:MAG: hypothetical protein MUF04_13885, partial [Akkermansiaceae bacterium]|nr:hypothetical protein [Akkermansiaceae bacterium]
MLWCGCFATVHATDQMVTQVTDDGPGSLRQAIRDVGTGGMITFAPALAGATITLASELEVTRGMTIRWPNNMAPGITISGGNATRVMSVAPGATVTLDGLTICDGRAANGSNGTNGINAGSFNSATSGGAGTDGQHGGGILNSGSLNVYNCSFVQNRAGNGGTGGSGGSGFSIWPPNSSGAPGGPGGIGGDGGAIYNTGTLFVLTSTFSGNQAGAGGMGGAGGLHGSGGRANGGPGGNGGHGGVLAGPGEITEAAGTLALNAAGAGGLPGFGGAASAGLPGRGGAIRPSGNLFIRMSLVANNTVADNGTGRNLSGAVTSQGFNLIGASDGATGAWNYTDLVGSNTAPIDPMLGGLADNGGATPTHALLPGSPAIDIGNDLYEGTDQRGLPRKSGPNVDIGAFEYQYPPDIAVDLQDVGEIQSGHTVNLGSINQGSQREFAFTIRNPGSNPLSAIAVSTQNAGPGELVVLAEPGGTVEPGTGNSTSFSVRYTATTAGPRALSLQIASNDPDENPFSIQFSAEVNGAPTDIAPGQFSIAENYPLPSLLGTLSAADPNAADGHVFSLADGTGSTNNNRFAISGNQLFLVQAVGHETAYTLSLRVRATDPGGLFFEKALEVTILDVNEPPSISNISTQIMNGGSSHGPVA